MTRGTVLRVTHNIKKDENHCCILTLTLGSGACFGPSPYQICNLYSDYLSISTQVKENEKFEVRMAQHLGKIHPPPA